MKLFLRSTAIILAALVLFAAGIAYASPGRTLEVTFLPGVKFVLNGDRQPAGDDQGMYADGKNRYPNHLVYNGNVYVPLRFVEEISNKYVFWHADSKTVFMWDKEQSTPGISFRELDPNRAPNAIKQWVQRYRDTEVAQVKNYGNKTYLLVTRGQKPTGGYGVSITQVENRGDVILATVRYTEPSRIVTPAVTYPLTLVEMPRVDKPVRFVGENGQVIPQLPDPEPQAPISGSANIKVYSLKANPDKVTLTGVVNVSNASVNYRIKEPWGKVIRAGSLASGRHGETWTPFNLVLSREDFGKNDRLQVTITRNDNDGNSEALQMSVYRSVLR